MARQWKPKAVIPVVGVIQGGQLDGWRYGFRRFVVHRERPCVLAYCTPPHWPFGREIVCTSVRARRFKAVAGERAKRLAVAPLIQAALAVRTAEVGHG